MYQIPHTIRKPIYGDHENNKKTEIASLCYKTTSLLLFQLLWALLRLNDLDGDFNFHCSKKQSDS